MSSGHLPTQSAPLMYTQGVGIEFNVVGVPQQQGSKTPWSQDANDNLKPWRYNVSGEAEKAMLCRDIFTGPVLVVVDFRFPRPKGHFGSGKNANNLKATAPVYKDSAPDLDKLLRAIGDALTGFVVRDDRQISRWVATKMYGGSPGATIRVEPLDQNTEGAHELDAANQDSHRTACAPGTGVPA